MMSLTGQKNNYNTHIAQILHEKEQSDCEIWSVDRI